MSPNDLLALVEDVSDSARKTAKEKGIIIITDIPEKMNNVIDISINMEKEPFKRLLSGLLDCIIGQTLENFIKFTAKSYLVYRGSRLTRDLLFAVEDSRIDEDCIDITQLKRLSSELGCELSVTYDATKGSTYKIIFTGEKRIGDISDKMKEKEDAFSNLDSLTGVEGIIDTERIRKRLGISMESIYSILEAFYKSMPARIKEAEDFVETDIDKYRIVVHGLKGALSNIGVEDLRRMAILLERAAVNKDISYIREYNPFFISGMNSFYTKLEAYLKAKPQTEKTINYHSDGTDDILKELLSDVTVYIKHLENLDAIDLLNNILNKRMCKDPEKIIRIISALDIYDYNSAYDMVMEILKS